MSDEKFELEGLVPETPLENMMDIENDWIRLSCMRAGWASTASIQRFVIPAMIDRRNLMGQARSGSGKTAAFLVGGLMHVDMSLDATQLLILVNTRELAIQVHSVITQYFAPDTPLRTELLIGGGGGGHHTETSDRSMRTAHVIVGTIGRITDCLFIRKLVQLSSLQYMVVDEFDVMLESGRHKPDNSYTQLCDILDVLPGCARVGLFSATCTPTILSEVRNLLPESNRFIVRLDDSTVSVRSITQLSLNVQGFHNEMLVRLCYDVISRSLGTAIIFVTRLENASRYCDIYRRLLPSSASPESVEFLDKGSTMSTRKAVFEDLRCGRINVLFVGGLYSRGIDVQGINLVINFEVPSDKMSLEERQADYIHRIGRSGRYGRKGLSITFVRDRGEQKFIQSVAQRYQCDIKNYDDPDELVNAAHKYLNR